MSDINFLQLTTTIIAEIINIEPEEIKPHDHLEDDLLMNLSSDLPKIFSRISQEVQTPIDKQLVQDFIDEAEDDTDKGTVKELAARIQDEITLNG